MNLIDFKQDSKKAIEGVVRKFGEDAHIRVARADNEKYQAFLRKSLEPYKGFRKGKIPDKVVEDAIIASVANHLLVEMVGFIDGGGDIVGTKNAVIEDTVENRIKVLSHPDYKDFRELVATMSQDFNQFKVETEEAEAGNFVA